MFCHTTQNWRGKALVSHVVIVDLIASTTTQKGLHLKAQRDTGRYAKGKIPTANQLAALRLVRNAFHGEWNYCIQPQLIA